MSGKLDMENVEHPFVNKFCQVESLLLKIIYFQKIYQYRLRGKTDVSPDPLSFDIPILKPPVKEPRKGTKPQGDPRFDVVEQLPAPAKTSFLTVLLLYTFYCLVLSGPSLAQTT